MTGSIPTLDHPPSRHVHTYRDGRGFNPFGNWVYIDRLFACFECLSIEFLMDESPEAQAAALCLRGLATRGCPPSTALWLTGGVLLSDTELGKALLTLLRPYDVSVGRSPVFTRCVADADAGPVRNVRRDLRVVDREKLGCLVAFQRMLVDKGIGPGVTPFVMQTANGKDYKGSRFIAFLHWQDALLEMLKIDFHGGLVDGGELTPVTQIYELQTGDVDLSGEKAVYRGVERACYLIFDWEILESYYKDDDGNMRISSEQIAQVAATFPMWVYLRLLSFRYVRHEDCLHVIVKKKSRAVSGDYKHSYHFIFEIVGIPVMHHKFVCGELVRPFARDKFRVKQSRSLSFLSDEQLLCPVWGMDQVNHGNQAFATLLSRKSKADPYPQLRRRIVFMGSVTKQVETFPPWASTVGDAQKQLEMLRVSSYTIPKRTAIAYTDEVGKCRLLSQPICDRTEAPRNRTVANAPSATSQGGETHPFAGVGKAKGSSLPGWLESVLVKNGGYKLNTSMSCLSVHRDHLQSCLEVSTVAAVHVTHMFCPAYMCQSPPSLHIHSNNGGIVAWDTAEEAQEVVYVRCPYCRMQSVNGDPSDPLAMCVDRGWLRLTRPLLESITHTGTSCLVGYVGLGGALPV